MSGKKLVLLLTAALFAATLWGCGSNRDSGDSVVPEGTGGTGGDEIVNAQVIGIDNCAQCHATYNQAWLEGRHANSNGSPGGPHAPSTTGVSCGNCHNQLEQAGLMPLAYPGEFQRDMITCESCHGGGSAHRGIGPIPYAKPGVDRCAQCHAEVDEETGEYVDLRSRGGHDAGATTAVTGYLKSGHADAPRDLSTRSGTVGCNRCHSDEGAKLYRNLNDIDAITDADGRGRGAMPLGEENISSIQCRTCHDTHKVGGDNLLMDATIVGGEVVTSAQYNTCTHCHADNDELNYHAGHTSEDGFLFDREILDTHFDDPTTIDIEGYNIRTTGASSCADCHDVHSAEVSDIYGQWARSGHAAQIGTVKAAAAAVDGATAEDIIAAAATEADGPAWVHYNFSTRDGCKKCHTATGAEAFLSDPENYDESALDFSHLAGEQREVLSCNGCHSSAAAGTLNASAEAGVITEYGVELPNVANSNTCLSCHTGRSGGNQIAESTADFSDSSFINSHYLAAGGVLFSAVGYEYDIDGDSETDDYVLESDHFKHDLIGDVTVEEIVDHGTVVGEKAVGAGPCVSCHMGSTSDHTWEVVAKDEDGVITAINSDACVSCHAGQYELTAEKLETEVHHYHAALEALENALKANGIFFYPSHPYFFKDANGDGVVPTPDYTFDHDADAETDAIGETARANAFMDWEGVYTGKGKDVMGAAFNYNLLHHEPGAYAHNRMYTKRLIFDSIDFLDNGVLDGTISVTGDAALYLGTTERP